MATSGHLECHPPGELQAEPWTFTVGSWTSGLRDCKSPEKGWASAFGQFDVGLSYRPVLSEAGSMSRSNQH